MSVCGDWSAAVLLTVCLLDGVVRTATKFHFRLAFDASTTTHV